MSLAVQPLRLAGPQLPFKVTGASNKLRSAAVRVNMSGRIVRCSAEQDGEKSFAEKFAVPAAALLGAALLFAGTPDEALAARSGGRMGGSSFSSRPRMAPSMPRGGGGGGPAMSGGASRTYNTYVAPPLISPYGGGYGYGMPFFGGGMGFFPMFGIGPLFNIMIIFFILNVVLNTIRSFTAGSDGGRGDGKSSDSIDDDEKW